jgi:hypothetical protein
VGAVLVGIPLNLIQKWLGHVQLSATAIYADAVGTKEHAIARCMWAEETRGGTDAEPTFGRYPLWPALTHHYGFV